MVVLGSHAALAAAILCAIATVASTTVAFTSIPALNLPALQAKRAISPTLREFKLALGECSGAQAPEATSSHTRRQALQHGVASIGGIALTMSAGAADAAAALPPVAEELKGYKLVNIFRVSLRGLARQDRFAFACRRASEPPSGCKAERLYLDIDTITCVAENGLSNLGHVVTYMYVYIYIHLYAFACGSLCVGGGLRI